MPEILLESGSPQRTERLAQALAPTLRGGEYISLEGELGAGKTLFSRSLIHALGAHGAITSPTFVLQKTYELPPDASVRSVIHYDFYRIQSYDELLDLGFEDPPESSVAIAEWGEKFVDRFPGKVLRVQIEGCGEDVRQIKFLFPDDESAQQFQDVVR